MPAIVQHAVSGEVLMLGYMNKEALEKPKPPARSPYSRTKQRLWTKGETRPCPQRGEHHAGL